MAKRSEGVRRIAQIISWVLALWALGGFIGWIYNKGNTDEIILWGIFIPVGYFAPTLILNAFYWVSDGFSEDKA